MLGGRCNVFLLIRRRRRPIFFELAYLSLQLIRLFNIILPTYPEMMHQHDNGLIAKDQEFTDVSPTDNNRKVDQTFEFSYDCHAWDSSSISWNWDYVYKIDGVWSYDKQTKTITLKAIKYKTYVDEPVNNISGARTNGLLDKVVSTPNFDLESSKEINCFKVDWEKESFSCVTQRALPRKK